MPIPSGSTCALDKLYSEVGVAQNSSQVAQNSSQVAQIAQVAQMRNLRCALCLFFPLLRNLRCALCLFFQRLRNLRCALCLFFSACAICVCESVNLIFVALQLGNFFQDAQLQNNF